MVGQVVIKAKGSFLDSEEFKIMEATEGIDDIKERLQLNVDLSRAVLKRIEQKIIDSIFISEMDLPLYIIALEYLTEVFKEAINSSDIFKEAMEERLEMLRRTTNVMVLQGKEPE